MLGYGSPASRVLCFHTKDKMGVICSWNSGCFVCLFLMKNDGIELCFQNGYCKYTATSDVPTNLGKCRYLGKLPLAGASELASYGAGHAALVHTTVGRMQPAEEGNRLIDTFNTLVPLEGTEQQDL